ncbi:MAG TPA: hypothetical protein VFH71_11855 [Rhodanobacteraceae bacterium]|nr:hypothetical protein [Rhodanobacteraceae bacterium]
MIRLPTPERAILVRVAVDQKYGQWNAPCNPDTGDFVYVPIPQDEANVPGMARGYLPVIGPAIQAFAARNSAAVALPGQLHDRRMHLDPDFDFLTYGDAERRGRELLKFNENDWVVFYSGMRPVSGGTRLCYGLIGLFVIDSVRRVADIPAPEYDRNAHTRLLHKTDTDIVVTGKPGLSGRFDRYMDIGELRDGSYRVRRELLEQWGGLTVNDGWIQRSANPPLFREPARFAQWLQAQQVRLLPANNPLESLPTENQAVQDAPAAVE